MRVLIVEDEARLAATLRDLLEINGYTADICGDGETAPKPGAGLMAPRVGVVSCHESNMVTRLILGEEDA